MNSNHQPAVKNTMLKPYRLIASLAVSTVMLAATASRAQLIYSQDFSTDDSANWATNYSHTGSNYVNFNFDYTTAGLPPAPHSTGGNTKGLKLSPDITTGSLVAGAVPGVSVSPTNFSVTDNFDMHADMWVNYNGAGPTTGTNIPGSGSGSTIIYGCGYGTAGTGPQVAGAIDSILCGVMTDNGASAHVRMYGPSQAGSYQDGVFQTTGTPTRAFPGEPFVYNNATGSRAFYTPSTWTPTPSPNWTNFFPSVSPPLAQMLLFHQQTNIQSVAGSASFAWHDVEVQKVGNVIAYLIDGHLVATGLYSSAGTPASDKLVFTAFDINSGVSADTNFAKLNFVVFANIVVSNTPLVVNVTASTPQASEADTNTPGAFTLTRNSSGPPLTVNFTLTGTATNGVQYTTVPTSVTFADGETTTNIYVYPKDDGISLPTTGVALNLLPGQGFGAAGSAVVNILDNDTPTVDISGTTQAYGRYTNTTGTANNDFALVNFTRRGKLITGTPLTVNLSYSGSAVAGADFVPVASVTIPDGSSTNSVMISPIDNASVYTNRTLKVNVAAGTGYVIGTGTNTATIVSANYVPAPVIFTDALNSASDATNWSLVYGSGDTMLNTNNFSADFGMDLNNAAGGIVIPAPPGGDAHALHLTANKQLNPGAPGAINAYYTNQLLSGNFAVRFQMNIIQGQQNQTEGAIFGINGTGSSSNWWYGGGYLTNGGVWSSDGIWYYVTAQRAGASAGDFQEYTGAGGTNGNKGWTRLTTQAGTSFTQAFKDNPGPFTSLDASALQTPGIPANSSPSLGYDAGTWADVEIKQQDGIVSLSINRTLIFSYTNTTVWKSGYLMLGYEDPFGDSIGSADAGVYYANLQVVQLPTVRIDNIAVTNSNDLITFTSSDPLDISTGFNLLTSTNITGTYTNLTGTFAPVTGSQFQVTTPFTGGAKRFFRITHK
jgi:hypothetical protein